VVDFGVGPRRPLAAGGERQREKKRKNNGAVAHRGAMLGQGED
jgi:hypothetical protein